jgi:pantoate kinase
MLEARAFSPCHITGFFEIFDRQTDLLHVGSKGAGVSLKNGIETAVKVTEASRSSAEVKINGVRQESAEISKRVLKRMLSKLRGPKHLRIDVDHTVGVPMGAGFGTSGAIALSLSLALNEAFELSLSRIEAAQVAHVAEVECKTGLGTVIAETFGGVEIRVAPGGPGVGKVKQLHVLDDTVVACLVFGPLSTREALTNPTTRDLICHWGKDLVDKLATTPDVPHFLRCSREFAEHVGLVSKQIRNVLNATDKAGFVCSMPMFGDSAFTLVERKSLEELLLAFKQSGQDGLVVISDIDFDGARVLE